MEGSLGAEDTEVTPVGEAEAGTKDTGPPAGPSMRRNGQRQKGALRRYPRVLGEQDKPIPILLGSRPRRLELLLIPLILLISLLRGASFRSVSWLSEKLPPKYTV